MRFQNIQASLVQKINKLMRAIFERSCARYIDNSLSTAPTFYTSRDGRPIESVIDLCLCNSRAYTKIAKCFTDTKTDSLSDHRYITMLLQKEHSQQNHRPIARTTRKFRTNANSIDWAKFQQQFKKNVEPKLFLLDDLSSKSKIDLAADTIEQCISLTSKSTLPRYRTAPIRKLPWIDDELKRAKIDLQTAYKRWKRSLTDLRRQYNYEKYIELKTNYKKLFKTKRRESWRTICEEATKNNAFQVFRSVKPTNKSPISTIKIDDQNYTQDHDDTLAHLVRTHFPNSNHPPLEQPAYGLTEQELDEIEPTNDSEIRRVFSSMNPRKAPGPDGISSDIILNCLKVIPNLLTNLFNSIMKRCHFPTGWKQATVCAMPKPGKTEITAKSFRMLSLMKTIAKGCEKLLNTRISSYLHSNDKLSPLQFGFVRQRSTIDACETMIDKVNELIEQKKIPLIVSFDIQGAFDSASWRLIIDEMKEMKVPTYLVNTVASYLSNRRNHMLGTDLRFSISQGCPQGSVLGPTLWKILINPLLMDERLRSVHVQAFADDITMVAGLTKGELPKFKQAIERAIARIFRLGEKRLLKFNASKTQAILITKKIDHPEITFEIGDQTITTTEQLTQLGLLVDKKLNFVPHILARMTSGKRSLNYLNKICSKTFGLTVDNAKTIYKSVIVPMVLYACEIWAALPSKSEIMKKLRSFQRSCAIAVCKTWRTIRTETAIMLINEMPLDYTAMHRYICRLISKSGILNEQPVELRTDWLTYTPEWRFEAVNLVPYDPDQAPTYDLQIYTDGSKREQGVGCAYIIKSSDSLEHKSFRLPDYCSPHQAEIHAVHLALQQIRDSQTAGRSVLLVTDAMKTIRCLNNPYKQATIEIQIRSLIDQLKQNNITVDFCWVAAHRDQVVELNAAADRLAWEATELEEISPEMRQLKMPFNLAKEITRRDLHDSWRSYLPELVSKWSGHFSSVPKLDQIANFHTSQFISGHGMFNEYRHRFKLAEDPSCPECGAEIESPEHILFQCSAYDQLRQTHLHPNKIATKDDLPKLKTRKAASAFAEFCKAGNSSQNPTFIRLSPDRPLGET